MMNKTILMLSVSCMSFIAGADLCYAGFNPYDTPPVLSAAMLKSHVSTHTSHLTAAHLSSLEDIAEFTLPENSGRVREGFKPSLILPKSLGREEKTKLSSSDLIRGSRWNKSAALSDLDTPVKPEYDRLNKRDNNLIQLAAACFVTDTTNCSGNEFSGNNADDNGHGAPNQPENNDDYDLDNAERCRQEGYTQTSCPPGYDKINLCPYDNSYFETCQEPCPDNYVACEPPYYGVGTACGNKYASCEKDTERACKELNPNYTNTCGEGQQLSSDRCSYDSSYGTCCNTCAGYPYTADTIPEGYVQDGETCTDCDGQEHFKVKPNPCDGFMDCGSMGPEAGANSCLSGTTTKYDNCKPCPNLGTLTSCPAPFTCTYEECSNRYYKSGCQSDYDWNASSQTCTVQCPNNYQYTCTPNSDPYLQGGSGEACNGKYTTCNCTSGYYWNGTKCATCVNKLEDGWTYNGDSCPYGYLTYESINDPSQCYHAKYKCNSCNNCQPGQFLIAGSQYNGSQTYKCSNTPPAPSIPGWGYTYSDDDIIIMIESTNSQLCQYNIYSLREIETTDQCEYYPHDEKILKTVYANKTKINAALTQLGKNPLPEDLYYPNPSCIKNGQLQSPCTGGPSDRLAVGKFNMSSGSLTEGYETCQESSSWGGIAPDKAHHLIIEKYNCQGEICKLEKTLPDKTSGF